MVRSAVVVCAAFIGVSGCAKKEQPAAGQTAGQPGAQAAIQAPDTSIMDEPDAEAAPKFGRIIAVGELPDGRMVVVDDKGNAVVRVDFITPAGTPLGHSGAGTAEYDHATGLATQAGDTLWLIDARNHRVDLISPQGELLPKALPFPASLSATPNAVDRQGRLYAAVRVKGTDSVQVIRVTGDGTHVDSLIRLGLPPTTAGAVGDAWDVTPDGDVMVAHAQPFHIEVLTAAGVRATGAVVPSAPPNPPFFSSATDHPRATPKGTFWVHRTVAADTGLARYDVFDRSAAVVMHVVLRPRSRVIGFSDKYVYVVKDSTDGEALRRYLYPR
jgi:hypothetical protein